MILGEFIFKNYYKRIDFTKRDSYYLLKKMKKKIRNMVLFASNLTKKYLTLLTLRTL